MNLSHDARHRQLIEQLDLGEQPLSAAEQALVTGCAECQEDLARLARVRTALEEAGTAQAQALDDARGRGDEAFAEAAVRQFAHAHLTPRGAPAATPRGLRPWLPLVAAAALVLAVWLVFRTGEEQDPVETLGGGVPQGVRPKKGVDRFTPFEWTGTLPEGGGFVVWVFAEGEVGGTHRGKSGRLTSNRWQPKDEEEATWPARIEWQVEVQGGADGARRSRPLLAWRR